MVSFRWNLESGKGPDDGFLRGLTAPFFTPSHSRTIPLGSQLDAVLGRQCWCRARE